MCKRPVKGGKNEDSNYFYLCKDCHAQLHLLYDENYLRDNLSTPKLILEDEKMIKFAKFASKQKSRIKKKVSNERRKKR